MASSEKFKTGDVVVLHSGGTEMTVYGYVVDGDEALKKTLAKHGGTTVEMTRDCPIVRCQWLSANGRLESGDFPEDSLRLATRRSR